MISAIVLTPVSWPDDDLAHAREIVVRSLVWLVSAVVSNVVRDVTLAVPQALDLAELADQSGCGLVEGDTEGDRLAAAVRASKQPRVLLLNAGYQPDAGLIEEIDAFSLRAAPDAVALLRAAPATILERFLPHRAPVVGILLPRALAETARSFDQLVRATRRQGSPLNASARPIF